MCGICGILNADQSETETLALVQGMAARLSHRGPDGEGFFSRQNCVLGHRRLAIIDLPQGQQPMLSADGRFVLVFNGEIYNYIELRKDLQAQGCQFRTNSDTEVLLQVLMREGESGLQRIKGMFAFFFLDIAQGNWMLVRDQFGIKPLYYVELGGELIFASEIKALLSHPKIKPRLDWRALSHYMTFQFCLDHTTLFSNIQKIEPGTFLQGKLGTSGWIARRYWDTDFSVVEQRNEKDYQEKLRLLMAESARLQVRSDVPVGMYLSGGIDSSIISILASRILPEHAKLFHGKFLEGKSYDESVYAKQIAQQINGELVEVVPTLSQFIDLFEKMIVAMDEPMAGPGLFPQFCVTKIAAQHVKVLLGGQGADELFGGYVRYLIAYFEQAFKGAIFGTQEEGKFVVQFATILPNLHVLRDYSSLMQHFWEDGLFGEMDERYFRLIDRSPDHQKMLSKEAAKKMAGYNVFEEFRDLFNHPKTLSYINKMTHFDLKTLLPALLHIEDRLSMAFSVETRVPFLDTDVVNFVTQVPPAIKFRDGNLKSLLKKTFAGDLPKGIIERNDKMGFPVPLTEWMKEAKFREFVHDTLGAARFKATGIFDNLKVESLLDSEKAYGRTVWGALCLAQWMQSFNVEV